MYLWVVQKDGMTGEQLNGTKASANSRNPSSGIGHESPAPGMAGTPAKAQAQAAVRQFTPDTPATQFRNPPPATASRLPLGSVCSRTAAVGRAPPCDRPKVILGKLIAGFGGAGSLGLGVAGLCQVLLGFAASGGGVGFGLVFIGHRNRN